MPLNKKKTEGCQLCTNFYVKQIDKIKENYNVVIKLKWTKIACS